MKALAIASKSNTLWATLFEADSSNSVLIIASATGVKQEYYKKFAQFVANNGVTVITFDYSGIGRSLEKPIKELKTNAADWGQNDLEHVLQFVV
ncbi:MAG: alpha/beta hydrolase, partial [Bacteroidota bacterium]